MEDEDLPFEARPTSLWGLERSAVIICSIVGLIALALIVQPWAARAHTAPLGWAYGWECCHNLDCKQVGNADVTVTSVGYRIELTGEVIPYNDYRIKRSRDEFYHRCAPGGDFSSPRSLCLYVPDMGF